MSIKSSTIATRFSINASPSGLTSFPSSSNNILAATAARLQNSAFQPIALEDTTNGPSNIRPLVTIVTTIKSTGNCWHYTVNGNQHVVWLNGFSVFKVYLNYSYILQHLQDCTISYFSLQSEMLARHYPSCLANVLFKLKRLRIWTLSFFSSRRCNSFRVRYVKNCYRYCWASAVLQSYTGQSKIFA